MRTIRKLCRLEFTANTAPNSKSPPSSTTCGCTSRKSAMRAGRAVSAPAQAMAAPRPAVPPVIRGATACTAP